MVSSVTEKYGFFCKVTSQKNSAYFNYKLSRPNILYILDNIFLDELIFALDHGLEIASKYFYGRSGLRDIS